jgi:hypothetical protein
VNFSATISRQRLESGAGAGLTLSPIDSTLCQRHFQHLPIGGRTLFRSLPLLFCAALLSQNAYAADPPQITSASCQPDACGLGSTLQVKFENLPDAAKQNIFLVLDGRVIKGVSARGPIPSKDNPSSGELMFDLKRMDAGSADSQANRDAWDALLSGKNRNVDVRLSIGGGPPFYGSATVWFNVYSNLTWIAWLGIPALLIFFLVVAAMSDLLRDGPSSVGGPKMSFSLGRCQMAWWTVIIVGSFLYIWAITLDWNIVPVSALVLMGISSATAMGSVLVDSNRNDQRKSLTDEKSALAVRVDQIAMALRAHPGSTAPGATVADLQAERDQKQARLTQVNTLLDSLPSPFGPSEGFLLDVLRDDNSISMHRFQMLVWTVVLGVVFGFDVLRNLAMPEFNATLLTLMGISSGTYVGFKIPDPPK